MAIPISDKTDFKSKFTRDKGRTLYVIKVSIQEEDIIIINTYTPDDRSTKYMKQKLTELKGEIFLQ